MNFRLLVLASLAVNLVAAPVGEREVARKSIVHEFPSTAAAAEWRLTALAFPDWLETVTMPEWQLLHASQTDDFYFAIFRSGGHLIFWNADRKGQFDSAATEVTAAGRPAGAALEPSKWVILEFTLKSPMGAISGQELGYALKIDESWSGPLTLKYTKTKAGSPNLRQTFTQTVPWVTTSAH